jgi:hypothetical protein
MSNTRPTFQPLISCTKAVAPLSMPRIVVTFAVFHFEMSALNVGLL